MVVKVCHVYYIHILCFARIHYMLYTLDPYIYYYSYYGSGYGPVVWSYVHCNGWEQDIHDCPKNVYPDLTCSSHYITGVLCKEGQLIYII